MPDPQTPELIEKQVSSAAKLCIKFAAVDE